MSSKNEDRKLDNFIKVLALANFLAAFGGGSILGRGLEVAKVMSNGRLDNTVLVYMLGFSIGVLMLKIMRSDRARFTGGVTSIAGGLTSLVLLGIFEAHKSHSNQYGSDWHAYLLFALLIIRFGLWFVSRSLRSDAAAGRKQMIAWVEAAYYVGIILGLIIWQGYLPWFKAVSFGAGILVLDAVLQSTAGILDILSSRILPDLPKEGSSHDVLPLPYNKVLYAKMAIAIVTFTAGIQIVALAFRNDLGNYGPMAFAALYAGAAAFALLYANIGVQLEIPIGDQRSIGHALIVFGETTRRQVPFAAISIISAALLSSAILANLYVVKSMHDLSGEAAGVVLFLIGASAFFYEIIALCIYDTVGKEANKANRKGLVAMMICLMALGAAAVDFLIDTLWPEPPPPNLSSPERHYALLLVLVVCVSLANIAVMSKRKGKDAGLPKTMTAK
jgi:hypothetical protein